MRLEEVKMIQEWWTAMTTNPGLFLLMGFLNWWMGVIWGKMLVRRTLRRRLIRMVKK
jgi:hypothetical protein